MLMTALAASAAAGPLDEMSLDRWAKLREVERYQMQMADRFYKQQNWKAALAEYEKYITLYEKSDGASYAQLKWGLSQVQLRKANTAVKDGFQTVLDYWPDSPDAAKARYHIGRTWMDMGRLDQAKKAYQAMLADSPLGKKPDDDVDRLRHLAAAHALDDLAEIAGIEKDDRARAECWKKLTFDVDRGEATATLCRQAAKNYTQWCFAQEAFEEGVRALATSYPPATLPSRVATYVGPAVAHLARDEQTRAKAQRLADQAAAWLRKQGPQDNQPKEKEAKEALRHLLQSVADLHAAAAQERQVGEVYEEIIRRCGVSDATLTRLAGWHESRDRFDEACKVYRRFEDKAE
ncbi:MAG: tetratricopeptide repeat protein, partial [Gemmatimonadales bacterium]